jgi:hypothetical protein
LIILRRPDHPWPLVLGGNRDEMSDRPWDPPARHWGDRPEVVAGQDRLAGGSWMGINDLGAVAVVMNRVGSLGPDPQRRSRGELVLDALAHAQAAPAARSLAERDAASYRPFNLFLGDRRDALWLRNDGSRIRVSPVPPGVHMLTARELDDTTDPRIAAYLPRFRAASAPDPAAGAGACADWIALLGSREPVPGAPANSAMCFSLQDGFATLSSALISIPAAPGRDARTSWLFAAGPPDRSEFSPVC